MRQRGRICHSRIVSSWGLVALVWAASPFLHPAAVVGQDLLPVAVYREVGAGAGGREFIEVTLGQVQELFSRFLPVNVDIRRLEDVSLVGRCPGIAGMSTYNTVSAQACLLGALDGKFNRMVSGLVIFPPLAGGRQSYFAGYAWLATVRARPAVNLAAAWCGDKASGIPGQPHWGCLIVVAHELMHLMGAAHDESGPTLMHPHAGKWATLGVERLGIGISERSRNEVLTHLDHVNRGLIRQARQNLASCEAVSGGNSGACAKLRRVLRYRANNFFRLPGTSPLRIRKRM